MDFCAMECSRGNPSAGVGGGAGVDEVSRFDLM